MMYESRSILRKINFIALLFSIIIAIAACTPVSNKLQETTGSTSAPPSSSGAVPAPTTPAGTSTPAATADFKADGIISNGEYASKQSYDNGNYEIQWKSDGTNIYMAMKVKTVGFVAVGIQPGTTMKDADIILGFVKDGKAQVIDAFSTGTYGPHPQDTELGGVNNILEYNGKEDGGYTVIEFKRALNTGDKYDNEIKKGKNTIIWSYGPSDSPDLKHSARGYGDITVN